MKFLFLGLLLLWIFGFSLTVLNSIQNPALNYFLSNLYSTVCHQDSTKCISIGDDKMLVCARCAGIYGGGMIAGISGLIIFFPYIKNRYFLISVFPLLIDVVLTTFRVYTYSQTLSFFTGLLFGAVAYTLIISELENLFHQQKLITGNE